MKLLTRLCSGVSATIMTPARRGRDALLAALLVLSCRTAPTPLLEKDASGGLTLGAGQVGA